VMNDRDRARPPACQRTSNGRRRSGLRRIAWIRTSNALMLANPLRPRRYASAHMTGSSGPSWPAEQAPGLGGHQEGQHDSWAGCARAQEPAATRSCQPAGYGHRRPRRVSATACVRAIHSTQIESVFDQFSTRECQVAHRTNGSAQAPLAACNLSASSAPPSEPQVC